MTYKRRHGLYDLGEIPEIGSAIPSIIGDSIVFLREVTQCSVSHIFWQDVAKQPFEDSRRIRLIHEKIPEFLPTCFPGAL